MARSIAYLAVSLPLCLVLADHARGQASVEYGLGAARGATTLAPAGNIGKALSGLAGSLNEPAKAAESSGARSSTVAPSRQTVKTLSSSASPSPQAPAPPPPPAPNWEDPAGIQAGLGYAELVRRFGPPAIQITTEDGRLLTYSGKDGSFQLEVQGEKVTSVVRPKP